MLKPMEDKVVHMVVVVEVPVLGMGKAVAWEPMVLHQTMLDIKVRPVVVVVVLVPL